VKAHLRGEAPPLSAQQLELVLDAANLATRELIGAERVAENYWLSHYFAGGACGGAWPGTLVCWARQETGACDQLHGSRKSFHLRHILSVHLPLFRSAGRQQTVAGSDEVGQPVPGPRHCSAWRIDLNPTSSVHRPVHHPAGMAKVILDIGVEAGVRINRPAALGEQVLLSVLSADPAAGTWQLSEAVPPPPPPRMMPIHPFASTNIPMSPMIHTEF